MIKFQKQKRLMGQIRKAIKDYEMIVPGDKVAVGVSGKDSISLLAGLRLLQLYGDIPFELVGVTLTLGIGQTDLNDTKELCREMEVPYIVQETQIGKIVFEERKEPNPCSLCAKLRRGALNDLARKNNCTKLALGHHRDDVIETLLLSTFYEGRIHTFSPITVQDEKGMTIIRPMVYLEEKEIKEFIRANKIQPIYNPCEANGNTKRQEMKEMLRSMSRENRKIKSNLFGAITRSGIEEWKEKI